MTDARHNVSRDPPSTTRSVVTLVFALAALVFAFAAFAGSLMLARAADYGWGAMSAAALGGLAVVVCVPVSLIVTLIVWLRTGRLSRPLQVALAVNGVAIALLLANLP